MLIMSIEAIKDISPPSRSIQGYLIKEARFLNPIIINEDPDKRVETVLHLQPMHNSHEKDSVWSRIKLFCCDDNNWTECFHAVIRTEYDRLPVQVNKSAERSIAHESIKENYASATQSCTISIEKNMHYENTAKRGIKYGDSFQLLEDIHWDGLQTSVAKVNISSNFHQTSSLVHPAVMDAAIQVLGPSINNASSDSALNYVPAQLRDAWMSASHWQPSSALVLQCMASLQGQVGDNSIECSISILTSDNTVLCTMKRLSMAAVSGHDSSKITHAKKLLYSIDWKPQLSMLSPQELQRVCGAEICNKCDTTMAEYRNKLDPTLDIILKWAIEHMTTEDYQNVPDSLKRHLIWMEHRVLQLSKNNHTIPTITHNKVETLLQELEMLYPPWRLYTEIARNLKGILRGEVYPSQLLFEGNLAENFYIEMFQSTCDGRLATFLDLAAHENPNMKIIEVGAGTGSMTTHILSTLQKLERQHGASKFSEYTYTDISPTFFEKAKDKWSGLGSRINFRTFNLEGNPTEQGFPAQEYDILIAGSCLHATIDLDATLQNIRKMLKPGGWLVFLEPIAPNETMTNFGFGLVSGWWRCAEDWRSLCPSIPESTWDLLLKRNGFSGNDMCLRDYKSDRCHLFSIIFTRAVHKTTPTVPKERVITIIISDASQGQNTMANALATTLFQPLGFTTNISSLRDFGQINLSEDHVVIILLELGIQFLSVISPEDFTMLKDVIRYSKRLFWISYSRSGAKDSPCYSLMKGFLRSLRSEAVHKQIISLAIESASSPEKLIDYAKKVFQASFIDGSSELEYLVVDGYLSTGRLIEEIELNKTMYSLIIPLPRHKTWLPGPGLELTVRAPGMLDSLQLFEDMACKHDLGPNEIEIEARAWGLNFRDVFIALGRLDNKKLGSDCAGVITRLGDEVEGDFKPGDRVCMMALGCMRTYPRAIETSVVKIPENVSFETAASILNPGLMVLYSLLDVARLQKGEKVLIHSAAGATGQVAIWVAKMIGAEIFATVGFEDKKKLLMENFGIPEDHIYYSRSTEFADGIMRITKGYGVDVVLNSLSGEGLRSSWECMAPYGRFVETGKIDIISNSQLPMASFSRNVSFAAVDLEHIMESNPRLVSKLLRTTMNLANDGVIRGPSPLHIYPVSDIESAFRTLQNGQVSGRIIISINPSNIVLVSRYQPKGGIVLDYKVPAFSAFQATDKKQQSSINRPSWRFDTDATYVVVGGLGGLGRAIIAWMARQGAKHLVVPSRSGPVSRHAQKLISDLFKKGVNIVAPKLDASDKSALATKLNELSHSMPPMKGCINSAMVLQVGLIIHVSFSAVNIDTRCCLREYDTCTVGVHNQIQDPDNLEFTRSVTA